MEAVASNYGPLPLVSAGATSSHGAAQTAREAACTERADPDGVPSTPPEPASLADTGVPEADIESLVLKVLLQRGTCTGGTIAEVVCLPRSMVGEMIDRLRDELLVTIKSSTGIHDYTYQLSDAGFNRAQQHAARCNFIGAAPVDFDHYIQSVRRQSIESAPFSLGQLRRALSHLVLQPTLVSQIAQALNDGRGLFLYGAPGNGKTSIAERVCHAFGQHVWIPQTITIHGELLRLYDPSCHEAVKSPQLDALKHDRRWVLVRRPTIVVGGELTLDYLETRFNTVAGIAEAPVQLKSNCGALVIDDFGRQRVSSTEILNRLIVPLEKHCDYLYLASGRQIQVPFDQLLVLSTNLEPRELLDEAFLRRIPYKVEVGDPTEAEFRELIERLAGELEFECEPAAIEHLIEQHYRRADRPFRFCHPRDLLRQIKNFCEVHGEPKRLTPDYFDLAVQNYFVGL